MIKAIAFKPTSSEDISDGLGSTDEPVPLQRRITARLGKQKALPRDVVRELKTEAPASAPAAEPADEASAIPDQSVRRVRIARVQGFRVPGAPDCVTEPVTEAMLRDPRRE